jgi:hypothetical protein
MAKNGWMSPARLARGSCRPVFSFPVSRFDALTFFLTTPDAVRDDLALEAVFTAFAFLPLFLEVALDIQIKPGVVLQ